MKISTAWFSPSGRLNHRVKSVDNPHLRAFNDFFGQKLYLRTKQPGATHGIDVQWANTASLDSSATSVRFRYSSGIMYCLTKACCG